MNKIFDQRYLTAANATDLSFADMVVGASLLRLLQPEFFVDHVDRVSVTLQTPAGEFTIQERYAPGQGPLVFVVEHENTDASQEFLAGVGDALCTITDVKKFADKLLSAFGDELPGVQRERFAALIAERAAGGV